MSVEDKKSQQSQYHIQSYLNITRTAEFEHDNLSKKISEFEKNIKKEVHDDLSKELGPESRKKLSKFVKEII